MRNRTSQWQAIRARYVANLTEKIVQLRAAWVEYEKDVDHAQGLTKMAALCHQLAGSGETYGFSAISKLAQELEKACRQPGVDFFHLQSLYKGLTLL